MGVFEMPQFAKGTTYVAEEMARCTAKGATTIVGGGDSVAAVAQAGLQVCVGCLLQLCPDAPVVLDTFYSDAQGSRAGMLRGQGSHNHRMGR